MSLINTPGDDTRIELGLYVYVSSEATTAGRPAAETPSAAVAAAQPAAQFFAPCLTNKRWHQFITDPVPVAKL